MYTTRRVNIRQGYGTSSSIIQTLAVGTELTRTGVSKGTADGYSWSRVSYNGVTGYVITGALTYDKPVEEVTEPTSDDETEEPSDDEEIGTDEQENVSNEDEETLKQLSEELGAIPEVGVNIMPFMFLGSLVSCIVMMWNVKKSIKNNI
jgi:uncharacterized protein YgiM (DUF1202 family)